MRTAPVLGIAGVVILGGAVFFLTRPAPTPPESASRPVTTVSLLAPARPPSDPPARSETSLPLEATVPSPASASSPAGTAIERIEAAVVTYDAASLPVIAPFLTDPDPELRLAAREGLLQMGLSAASPLLREAAGKMNDPREAIELLDAADFLALPSLGATGSARVIKQPPPFLPPGSAKAPASAR